MREFQVIQDFLPDLQTKSSDPPADYAAQQKVHTILNKLLGQSAQFLMPTLFQSGRLLLITKAPVWAAHIKNRQQSITDEATILRLKITEIVVKVQPVNQASTEQALPEVKRALSTASLDSIAKVSDEIENPKLKEAFSRLQARIKNSREGA
ncbi:MAG: hypothetical protein ACI9J2_000305 [Saprospiraceae bacterium]|jgi:hypothetical protein